ncbi:MAG: hypothetical protein HY716_09530 [Planctomycetes bacterium]|nr:hypothetical protein [Planctomycetota bacterium]
MHVAFLIAFAALQSGESFEARRDRICARIEELRGLRFKSPIDLREGSRKAYAELALEDARALYGGDLAAFESVLKALGLVSGRLKLELAIPMYAAASVQAYVGREAVHVIDPNVPDDELIYKFTLALSTQQRDWKPERASYDAQMALLAIRHGEADMTKQLYWADLKVGERRADRNHVATLVERALKWERETSRFASLVAPRIFVRSSDFIWRRGGIFMETMRREGFADRLAKVYAGPPVSTEQILHPEKYVTNERPVELDLKPVDEMLAARNCTKLYETTLGELGVAIYLETLLENPDSRAPEGWGGDRLGAWKDPNGKLLIVWATEWDSGKDAFDFERDAARAIETYRREGEPPPILLRGETARTLVLFCPTDYREEVEKAVGRIKRVPGSR